MDSAYSEACPLPIGLIEQPIHAGIHVLRLQDMAVILLEVPIEMPDPRVPFSRIHAFILVKTPSASQWLRRDELRVLSL